MKKPLLTAKELSLISQSQSQLQSPSTLLPIPLAPPIITITQFHPVEADDLTNSPEEGLTATLKDRRVLNSDQSRPIYYYDFFLHGDVKYEPGDSFGFYPELSDEEVNWLGSRLQVDLNQEISLSASSEILSSFFPLQTARVQLRKLIARLDIKSFPKKALIRTLAEHCQDETESLILLFLSSRLGSDAYNRLRTEFLSVQVLLAALDSLKLSLETLIGLVGTLQPRYYSCCRRMKEADYKSFQIVFNVSGICSSWLERLKPTDELILPIKQRSITSFRLPAPIESRPIIMIAAGTGIAPFIGFLEVIQNIQGTTAIPFSWLIFGFRNFQNDFIFKEELQEFCNKGTLSKLSLAVSRDEIEPKTHVQDIITLKEKELFSQLIFERDAIIYVCGDELTMIKGVNDAIVKLIQENNSGTELTQKDAEGILMNWTREKKIIRDVWV